MRRQETTDTDNDLDYVPVAIKGLFGTFATVRKMLRYTPTGKSGFGSVIITRYSTGTVEVYVRKQHVQALKETVQAWDAHGAKMSVLDDYKPHTPATAGTSPLLHERVRANAARAAAQTILHAGMEGITNPVWRAKQRRVAQMVAHRFMTRLEMAKDLDKAVRIVLEEAPGFSNHKPALADFWQSIAMSVRAIAVQAGKPISGCIQTTPHKDSDGDIAMADNAASETATNTATAGGDIHPASVRSADTPQDTTQALAEAAPAA
jgi:hypothetical protein